MNKIIIFILILISLPAAAYSARIINNGAKVFLNDKVFVKVINLEIKNTNNGEFVIREASELRVEGADVINENGTFILSDVSILEVNKNLINKDVFNNESSSKSVISMNVVNSGIIFNESIIEIGE
ncbi:MAG: hypothetical protein RO257_14295 [Candidatus Kapabacteria bacterium]|nr:hypothetical protein [Candidatus Kapabacteria bacterium]